MLASGSKVLSLRCFSDPRGEQFSRPGGGVAIPLVREWWLLLVRRPMVRLLVDEECLSIAECDSLDSMLESASGMRHDQIRVHSPRSRDQRDQRGRSVGEIGGRF